MLFAEDAGIASHSPSHLQYLMDRFANTCTDFVFNQSKKKSSHKQPNRLKSQSTAMN